MKDSKEMTDQELVDAWFTEVYEASLQEILDNSSSLGVVLPDILDSESAFNEWVLPAMKRLALVPVLKDSCYWIGDTYGQLSGPIVDTKNNCRFRAAVEGALEIWRQRGA